ncbi:MAG: 4Fe-4S binding protein [Candidatus Krumholzibacteria bacterium]|jgi:polyferredoxin|nr:4Fe-4S binding protein [Candidatus Krumholzibacteria bacterium]MDP6668390.1 4Fe-4S binding protein [Candidatus Krumholzibacteria bacterium]
MELDGRFGKKGLKTYVLRLALQTGFAAFLIWIGFQFSRYFRAVETGSLPLPDRPTGAEGFLPVSGLMGLLDWFYQGQLNSVHPAATVLVLAFTLISLVFRKSFCSWICPVGLLSESLARWGRRIFGRNFRIWKWLDIPLRSVKYALLLFFALSIAMMSAEALQAFIHSPYNKVSDLKMYAFFADPSVLAGSILAVLAIGSVFVHGFWCRYLCPYGAWLGLFSWASPVSIRRSKGTCTDCGLCDRVCMARLPVSSKDRILSVECTGCLDCVASCPVPLTLKAGTRKHPLRLQYFAGGLLAVFLLIYLAARVSGYWQSGVEGGEMVHLFRIMDQLSH